MILLSHPTGNENVRQAALALREAGLLHEFWTCLSWNSDGVIDRLLPSQIRQQLRRRSLPRALRKVVRTVPVLELARLVAGFARFPYLSAHETGLLSIDAVVRDLDHKVATRLTNTKNIRLVYAYEDGAGETFRAAKSRDIRRLYDLPIGYWRVAQGIYAEERAREPQWAATLTGTSDSEGKLTRKEEELQLAEHVIVASSFTKRTLSAAAFPGSVTVVPYGAPSVTSDEIVVRSGPLRVLFVGSLGQRKGLSYLLAAVESLGPRVELTLLGRKVVENCPPLNDAVLRHRWIPSLGRAELLEEMQHHDVLVLPSLFEGFGLVILEAMSQGLLVITTPNTGGPDVIEEGLDGFIVPLRSAEAIAARLEALSTNADLTRAMRVAAREKADKCHWTDYRRSIVRVAQEMLPE
ncbi:MAG: glycosyltransferase family 4 protein, partial [Chthoniobacterales bacterium]